ncbi:MAG: hypothetical protein ACREA7_09410 [Nitrosotalea sp.]
MLKSPFKMAKNEKEWIQYMLGKGKTMKDLLKIIQRFPVCKYDKEESHDMLNFVNWLWSRVIV